MDSQADYNELATGGDSALFFSFLGCGLSRGWGWRASRKQNFRWRRRPTDGVLMQPTDLPLMRDAALLAVQVLRQGGLNLDVQPMGDAGAAARGTACRGRLGPVHHLHPRDAVALADR